MMDNSLQEMLQDKLNDRLNHLIEEGKITYSQMYASLGYPTIKHHFGRLDPFSSYVNAVIRETKAGRLVLYDSSWGEKEALEENKMNTAPGLDDMYPNSAGYNNVGGPQYDISLSKDNVVIEACFCGQQIEGWSTMEITYVWQNRTFCFKPASEENSDINALYVPFGKWILTRYLDKAKDSILNNYAERIVSEFIEKEFVKLDLN